MGKAAKRKSERRANYLAYLAAADPEKFKDEWDKRMDSWLSDVKQQAGSSYGPRAFRYVDLALHALAQCGNVQIAKNARRDVDALENECCQAFRKEADSRLFRITMPPERKP